MFDWWIGVWSDDAFNLESETYIWSYAILGVVVMIFLYLRAHVFVDFTIRSSEGFQRSLLNTLLRSPL